MYGQQLLSLHRQRGVSLSGLIVVLGIIFMFAALALKVVPHIIEYKAIQTSIAAAKREGGSPTEMRSTFNKNADINSINSIAGKDLIITKVNNDTEIAFDYESRIPLFTNVALVIRFADTTDPTGIIPEKPEVVAPR